MGRHHHHSKDHRKDLEKVPAKPQGSLLGIYRRLLKNYALKHWGYLLIGILFAIFEGGALNFLCHGVGMVATGFNGKTGSSEKSPQTAVESPSASLPEGEAFVASETAPVAPEGENKLSGESPSGESEASMKTPAERRQSLDDKQLRKVVKYVDKINGWLEKVGLPRMNLDFGDGEHFTADIVIALLVGLVLLFVTQAVAMLVNRYCLKCVGARVVTDMRTSLYCHLLDQSQAFFSHPDRPVGALISRCTNDINAVETVISVNFPELVVAPVQIIACAIFLVRAVIEAHLPWKFALVLLVMVPTFVIVYALCRVLKKFQHSVLDGVAEVTDRMAESFSGIKEIRAFNQEEREKSSFSKTNERYFRRLKRAIGAEVLVHPVLHITAMCLVGIFIWMCYDAGLTLGVLTGMVFAAQNIYKPLKDLVKVNAGLQKGAAAAERFFELMDEDTRLPVPENPRHIQTFQEKICFEKVSFRYNSGEADVLKDLELDIRKGDTIALVGQTGSGKSTAANLLARFYDPTQGRITVDGIPLTDLDTRDYRHLVGMVSQDTFLFNTSIEENIRYGRPDATHEEVVEAARQANALEFIEQDPRGFQRCVGERGNLLSGGQRQRIAIARAILLNPPILILDEATSALDTVTEMLVQGAINNMMRDRTVLVIAHRLSTIRNASCILVMEGGRVVERGTNQELLERGGEYKKLVDMQFHEVSATPEAPQRPDTA